MPDSNAGVALALGRLEGQVSQLITVVETMRDEVNSRATRHEDQDIRDFREVREHLKEIASYLDRKADKEEIARLLAMAEKKIDVADFIVVQQDVMQLNGERNWRKGFAKAIYITWVVMIAIASCFGWYIKTRK